MKKIGLLLFTFTALQVLAQEKPSEDQFFQLVNAEKKANAHKLLAKPASVSIGYDVTYYRCKWQVDPSVYYIHGNVTTYFKPTKPGFDTLCMDLSDSLTVDSIKHHGLPLNFFHSGDVLCIQLPAIIGINVPDSITVYYQGRPRTNGFGSFITSEHNGAPILWTLSEPYGASEWWPCKNSLTDKADSIDILINTPAAYRAASNGKLIAETYTGTNKTWHWRHRYPIATYLVCMAVSNYAQYSHDVLFGTSITKVLNYVYPEDSSAAAIQTPNIIPVMQLFDTLFGLYPFATEKYGQCQFGWGGGMEHQTFTFLGGFGYDLMSHELAHQWFGDKVTCRSWEDIWLNEGFATYLNGLCYEHLAPEWWMLYKQWRINQITSLPGGSVWCSDTTDINRIFDSRLSYSKGAMILHQLRWVIGDSAFYTALRNYLNDPLLAYGTARTADLKSHIEEAIKQDLTWYFDDWFQGEGFPSYQISWDQIGNQVTLSINQTQSHPSIPFFELPLPVLLKNATQDTLVRLDHTFSGQTFTLVIPFTVDSVLFDPDLWLITAGNTVLNVEENLLDDLITISPNPVHDDLRITINKNLDGLDMCWLDEHGKLLYEQSNVPAGTIHLNTLGFSPGIYILRFFWNSKIKVRKVVVR